MQVMATSYSLTFVLDLVSQNPKTTVKETSMATSNPSNDIQSYPIGSLYVGDLHPDVTEAMLFDKFATAGPILSIRVCRDMITRRSLGYAYVNFRQPADAKNALETMNSDLLRGRPLRIMWSQRDPTLRKSGVGNVFIKNLDENIDHRSLYDTFSVFGNIIACKVMADENGKSKGFGFIHFETEEAADNAISKVNGMLLADKKVYVGRFISRNQRTDVDGPRKFLNIFFKNFDDQLDEENLRDLFSKHGKIISFKIEKDKNGHSKGFGFCSYENPEEAEEAVRNLNGYKNGDKELFVGRFQMKHERQSEIKRRKDLQQQERMRKYQGLNLYIKNLDDTIDDELLKQEFSKFGTIISAKIMSENGQSKGFGFVCFSAPDEAIKAVTEMNGSMFGSKRIYVSLAQRKEERRAHLSNQHMQRIITPRLPASMELAFLNRMNGMMTYLPPLMGPIQAQNYFPPTAMPMTTRLTLAPGQMIPNGFVRPQQTAAYTRTATNIPLNNLNGFSEQRALTPADLAYATPQQQKQMLGDRLFPLIRSIQPEFAGRITTMLLEIDNTELLQMLESPEVLQAKVEEALTVLSMIGEN